MSNGWNANIGGHYAAIALKHPANIGPWAISTLHVGRRCSMNRKVLIVPPSSQLG
jgi:hypothetical protein